LVLLQVPQSGSAVDDEEVSCQFVALMNVKPQLEGGLQQPDCTIKESNMNAGFLVD